MKHGEGVQGSGLGCVGVSEFRIARAGDLQQLIHQWRPSSMLHASAELLMLPCLIHRLWPSYYAP